MNTMQANLSETLERFEANSAKREAEWAKRETRLLLAIAGMFAVAVAVLGYLTSQRQAPAPQPTVIITIPQAPAVSAPAAAAETPATAAP